MVPDQQAPSIPAVAPYYPRPPFLYRDCPFLVVTFRHHGERDTPSGAAAPRAKRGRPDGAADRASAQRPLGPLRGSDPGRTMHARRTDRELRRGAVPRRDRVHRAGARGLGVAEEGRDLPPARRPGARLRDDRARGVEIIRTDVELAGAAGPEDLALDPTWFNLKLIPSVTDGAPPDVMQLTETTLANVGVREARMGPTGSASRTRSRTLSPASCRCGRWSGASPCGWTSISSTASWCTTI